MRRMSAPCLQLSREPTCGPSAKHSGRRMLIAVQHSVCRRSMSQTCDHGSRVHLRCIRRRASDPVRQKGRERGATPLATSLFAQLNDRKISLKKGLSNHKRGRPFDSDSTDPPLKVIAEWFCLGPLSDALTSAGRCTPRFHPPRCECAEALPPHE